MKSKDWPAWFNGPNGESQIFNKPEDVPAGWTTGAEKRSAGGSLKQATHPIPVAPAPVPAPSAPVPVPADGAIEIDAGGWPWTADLHVSSKSKTTQGLWRMKVGVKRPDPKPLDL